MMKRLLVLADLIKNDLRNLNWRAIDTWPKRVRSIAIFVIGFIAWLVSFLFLNVNQYSALSTARQTETDLKQNLAAQIPKILLQKKEQTQLTQIKQLIEQKNKELPAEDQLGAVLDDLTQMATTNHLNLILLKPKASVEVDAYKKIPIEVNLGGDYGAITNFLNQLAHLPYMLYDSTVELGPPDDTKKNAVTAVPIGDLYLQMVIDMYYLAPVDKP